ncbi:MAG: peptidoglycan-binding protein, partial [Calditrichaeota bacterium]|nr:peptidoglycan-binding protein [Calditrichota bacterium]
SANINGTVQMLPIESFKESIIAANGKSARSSDWKTVYVGTGARTISMTGDGNYIFSAINNLSKVVVIDRKTFKVINEIKADSYPVGMDISPDNKLLVVTAQGRNREGGNSVMIYKITKDN